MSISVTCECGRHFETPDTDGLSNTLFAGESRSSVPWTKPEDLPLDLNVPLSGLGSYHGYRNNGFNALFADGSVRFLKTSISPDVLVAILTRNGNEMISYDLDPESVGSGSIPG